MDVEEAPPALRAFEEAREQVGPASGPVTGTRARRREPAVRSGHVDGLLRSLRLLDAIPQGGVHDAG